MATKEKSVKELENELDLSTQNNIKLVEWNESIQKNLKHSREEYTKLVQKFGKLCADLKTVKEKNEILESEKFVLINQKCILEEKINILQENAKVKILC